MSQTITAVSFALQRTFCSLIAQCPDAFLTRCRVSSVYVSAFNARAGADAVIIKNNKTENCFILSIWIISVDAFDLGFRCQLKHLKQ